MTNTHVLRKGHNMASCKKKKKKKKSTERIPQYRDADGQYLALCDEKYVTTIAWWLPEEQEFGLVLANTAREEHTALDGEETTIAVDVCRKFFKDNKLDMPVLGRDFTFDARSSATKCLRLINAALYAWQQKKPWPDWATRAYGAGWQPPKGWKP